MANATEHAFRKAISSGSFAPVYYLYGEDDFRKEDAVAAALAAAVPAEWRDFDVDVRRGPDLDGAAIVAVLETPPLSGTRRAIAIRDVGGLKKDARRQLERYLERAPSDVLLMLVASGGDRIDRALADRAVAVEFPVLAGDRLPRWIAHRASQLGVPITSGATALLQEAAGTDLAALASELDKLASYARGSHRRPGDDAGAGDAGAGDTLRIDESAVAAVVGVRRGETLGDLLDRVAERDVGAAIALVEHVLTQPKASAVGTVMALGTQTLALAWGRARRDQGIAASRLTSEFFTLLKETGANPMRPWGDAVATWARTVDRWTPATLGRALEALTVADTALKETRMTSDEQVVGTLVLAMCVDVGAHAPDRAGAGREAAA